MFVGKEKDRAMAVLLDFWLYFYFSGLREFTCIRGGIVLPVECVTCKEILKAGLDRDFHAVRGNESSQAHYQDW